jgi:hypothetical protein
MNVPQHIGTIYCDMDGVLVNFIQGTKNVLHRDWDSFKGPQQRAIRNKAVFESGPHVWANFPPEPDMHLLWNYVRPFNPGILTAYPRGEDINGRITTPNPKSTKYAKEGKWEWVQKYLKVPFTKFHCVAREHKREFATSAHHNQIVSNVLIDDTPENIQEFIANRGIGILHKNAYSTIQQLKAYGIINPEFSH